MLKIYTWPKRHKAKCKGRTREIMENKKLADKNFISFAKKFKILAKAANLLGDFTKKKLDKVVAKNLYSVKIIKSQEFNNLTWQ